MGKRVKLAGAACVVTAAMAAFFATTGVAAAVDDRGGPVVFVNKHGAPGDCVLLAKAVRADGTEYFSDDLRRGSCDGTLWLPPLEQDSTLKIDLSAYFPDEYHTVKEFKVQSAMNWNDVVDNNTAICFLAKADGEVTYTNMSAKGGDCNGD